MTSIQLSIAILAGGASSRFGSDKATVNFRGMPLIKHLLWRFRKYTDDLFLVSRFDSPDRLQLVDVEIVYDSHPTRSVMGAVIDAIVNSRNQWVFVLAVDLPLITYDFIEWMVTNSNLETTDACMIVPSSSHGAQPLCALYNKSAESMLRDKLLLDQQRLKDISNDSNCIQLKVPAKLQWQCLNMNTPDDLHRAERLAEVNGLRFT